MNSNIPGSTRDRLVSDSSCVTASDTDDMLSDDMLSDDEIYYDEMDDEMTAGPHPLLNADLSRVIEEFGEQAVNYTMYPSIDEVDILLNVNVQHVLDEDTASAWGVHLLEPIVVFLQFKEMSSYLDGVVPEIEVYQPSNRDTFCPGVQIKQIVELFIAEQFKDLSCKLVEESVNQNQKGHAVMKTPNMSKQTSTCQVKCDDPKTFPSLQNGFLCQLMNYILQRIRTLNEFCVICDERHTGIFDCALLKPCVCAKSLCVFSFQTLGVMSNAAETVVADADVVDLLIAMANAAVCSERRDIIFDPYPSIVDPNKPHLLALDPLFKNYDHVKEILQVIISSRVATMKGESSHLKEAMDEGNICAFPLMQWILTSNRSHIVLLPPEKRIQSMKTDYQFLLVSSPPAKEQAFQKAKAQYGSTYAFHGSSIENWHSILRKGLLNASGTRYQMHGAVYGRGIYLSPVSSVSFGYTHSVKDNTAKMKGLVGKTGLTCIALCEVICRGIDKHEDVKWVCHQEDYVCTRLFFVYDSDCSNANIDTRNSDILKEISHAVSTRTLLKETS